MYLLPQAYGDVGYRLQVKTFSRSVYLTTQRSANAERSTRRVDQINWERVLRPFKNDVKLTQLKSLGWDGLWLVRARGISLSIWI